MSDPVFDQSLKKQITTLKENLAELQKIKIERQQYGQKECSRIINNFKRELLMKPGTILVKILDKNILKEDDVIIYQREQNSPFIFGFYKKNSEKFKEKDIFTFVAISEERGFYAFAKSIESDDLQIVKDPNDELMLVEINKENLGDLEPSHETETGEMYAPIVIKLSECFKIGKIVFLQDTPEVKVEVEEEPVTNDTRYFTFISELEHNEKKREKFQNSTNPFNVDPYNMVTSIQTE